MIEMNMVVLRPASTDDLPFVAAWRTSLDLELAAQSTPPRPLTAEIFRSRLVAPDKSFSSGGDGDDEFIVAPVNDAQRAIGIAGLYAVDQHNGIAEFGVTFGESSHRGKGMGFDAHLALLYYGFQIRRLHRMYAFVKSDNGGVLKLCSRLGMQQEGVLRQHRWKNGAYVDAVVLGILRSEWNQDLVRWRDKGLEE